ncbi:MAG: PSD1 and planctomycete cytochrome C domain-containing protein [Pirellulales bacterium]
MPLYRLLTISFLSFTALVCTAALPAQSTEAPDAQATAFFEEKIRPVLVEHCYSCHSAEAQENKKLQASLFLDTKEGTLKGGENGPALVAGNSAESLLLKGLKYDGLEMPPSGKLSDEIIADFATWIESGAVDPRQGAAATVAKRVIDIQEGRNFWSFRRLAPVTPPEVKNTAWGRTPIDQFITARHEEHGLQPNGPASREKLVRRVYYDLIGLPPSPEQVAAFVQDESADAYEKLIDQLLASEHYGERWGRHWLDTARYAESGGYEFDGFRPGAYHYRDWVIRGLNHDMPYNEFVRMQIAGDKLLPGDYQGGSAVGFLVAGPYPGQLTQKTEEKIRYDQIDDMIMTIGGSMMGLTLGCVRCHEHKYDPFPQQDYYGIAAALGRTVHGDVTFDPDPAATQRALAAHDARRQELAAAVTQFAAQELPGRFSKWQQEELPKLARLAHWQILEPLDVQSGTWLNTAPDGLVVYVARGKNGDTYTVNTQTYQRNITSLRLDAFTDKSLPANGPGLNGDGGFSLQDFKVTARPLDAGNTAEPITLKLKGAQAAYEEPEQPLAHAVDDNPGTFWRANNGNGKDNGAILEIEGGLPGWDGGTRLTFELKFASQGLGRFRLALSTTPVPASWAGDIAGQHLGEIQSLLAAGQGQLAEAHREPMARWLSPFDAETGKVVRALEEHIRQRPRPPLTDVYATVDGGRDVFLLRRGEVDNKQDKAEPGFLQVLAIAADPQQRWLPAPADGQTAVDPRVGLADWMVDVEQGAGPLLARVMANRLWQHHFGRGIVATPNDFGEQGDRPTHPELLEWLAGELVRGGWKLKPLHKLMMLSSAYTQSSDVLAANEQIDPANQFLWHHQPRRLEAEIIRDALLEIGGSLDVQMYGPSTLDNSARRSIYVRVKRSEMSPFLTMFDAPEPLQSIGQRSSTTVPTQALAMMNSPFVRQQAEKLLGRIRLPQDPPAPPATLVDRAYQIALSRLPTEAERTTMLSFIEGQQSLSGDANPQSAELALVDFCQLLLCLNEFIYVD